MNTKLIAVLLAAMGLAAGSSITLASTDAEGAPEASGAPAPLVAEATNPAAEEGSAPAPESSTEEGEKKAD
ncbi:MAG: hypothetical protein HYY28_02060 [Betaproteobacteria bacterium]|nr:hypothetical protein [Betaproteobacteria bacterium]MBI2959072.1 hypothetical protein [Betaproteobacteria bacterium]